MTAAELKEALVAMIAAVVAIIAGATAGHLYGVVVDSDASVFACVAYGTAWAIASGLAVMGLRNDLSKDPV